MGILGWKIFNSFYDETSLASDNARVARYLEIGEELYKYCPTCSLATSEIGGLGYSFKGVVFDGFGLGDPEALRFHPLRIPEDRPGYYNGAIPPKYIEYRSPDFIVSITAFSNALRQSNIINNYYRYDCSFKSILDITWKGEMVQIYSKKSLSPSLVDRIECHPVK